MDKFQIPSKGLQQKDGAHLVRQNVGISDGQLRTDMPAAPKASLTTVQTIHIGDKSPVKTLAIWFEVEPNVIRKWVRGHPPVFMGVNAVNSEVIIKRTRAAGEAYSRAREEDSALSQGAN